MNPWVLLSCLCVLTVTTAEDARTKREYPNLRYIVQQPSNAEYQEYYKSSEIFQKFFPNLIAASIPATQYGAELSYSGNTNTAFTSTSGGSSYQAYASGSSSFNSPQVPYGYNVNVYPVIYHGSSGGSQQIKPVFENKYQFESGSTSQSKYPQYGAVFTSGSLPSANNPSTSAIASSSSTTSDHNNSPPAFASVSSEATSNAEANINNNNNNDASSSAASQASAGSSASTGASSTAHAQASSSSKGEASSSAQTQTSSSATAQTSSSESSSSTTAEASSSATAEASSTASDEASSSSSATASANSDANLVSRFPSLVETDAENGIFLLAVPTNSASADTSGKGKGDYKILHLAVPNEILKKLLAESSKGDASKLSTSIKNMVAAAVAEVESSATASSSSASVLKDRGSFENSKSNEDKITVTKLPVPAAGISSAETSDGATFDNKDVYLVPIDENSGYFTQFLPEYFYDTQSPTGGGDHVVFTTTKDDADFFKNVASSQTVTVVGTKVATDSKSQSLDNIIKQVFINKPAEVSIGNRNGEDAVVSNQKVAYVVSGSKYPRIVIRYPNSKLSTSSSYKVQPATLVLSNGSGGDKQNTFKIVSKDKVVNSGSVQNIYGDFGPRYGRYA